MSEKQNPPIICVEIKRDFPDELQLLKLVKYHISNRDIISAEMIDYSYDYSIKIISGMKSKVFNND